MATPNDDIPVHESTRKRRRWGCTCGCLAVLVVVMFSTLGGAYYLLRDFAAPAPYPTPGFLTTANTAIGTLRLDPADENVSELVRVAVKRLKEQAATRADDRDATRTMLGLNVLQRVLTRFVRPETHFTLGPGAQGAPDAAVWAVPLRNRFGLLAANLALNEFSPRPVEGPDSGARVFGLGRKGSTDGGFAAVTGPALLISNSEQAVRDAARAAAPANAGPSDELRLALDQLSADATERPRQLTFAATLPPGRAEAWLASLEKATDSTGLAARLEEALASQKAGLSDLRAMAATGDLVTADKFRLILTLDVAPADHAKRWAEALKTALGPALSTLDPGATGGTGRVLTVKADAKLTGNNVVCTVDFTGLKALIERAIPVAGKSAAARPARTPVPEDQTSPAPAAAPSRRGRTAR